MTAEIPPARSEPAALPSPEPGGAGESWFDAMKRGDFAAAWRISDRVLRQRAGVPCFHWPRHEQYVWDGRTLAERRVLIRCYHGLGDTVQFIRFAPLVKAVAAEVIIWAQPELLGLLRTAPGVDRLLPLHDGTPEIDYDVDVEVMELAHVFRCTPETLPRDVPYFRIQRDTVTHRGNVRRVGLVWESGGWDRRRSIPVQALAPLTRIAGVELHCLQQGPARQAWQGAWGPCSGSPEPLALAQQMAALDLVISVDSFPAHLAGALGVPAWTLLHADPDWRWMRDRPDSPWYPTMRLFRQSEPGEWGTVIDHVARRLAAMAE